MIIDIATLFPQMFEGVLSESILGRARNRDEIEINCLNIRDFTDDTKHKRVDDSPYGGGTGMVMRCEPIYRCFEHAVNTRGIKPYVVYMSPQGKTLSHSIAAELSKKDYIFILCGHYEGVDQRVLDSIVDAEISIGDYVLTGGEIPAMVLVDAVSRLSGEVLLKPEAHQQDSFANGLLEHPQYTKPYEWRGQKVPDVLISGDHKKIEQYRENQQILVTKRKRPDLLKDK